MSKKVVIALLILAVVAVVLILTANKGSVPVNLVFDTVRGNASIVYLVWMCIGVLIGGLLI